MEALECFLASAVAPSEVSNTVKLLNCRDASSVAFPRAPAAWNTSRTDSALHRSISATVKVTGKPYAIGRHMGARQILTLSGDMPRRETQRPQNSSILTGGSTPLRALRVRAVHRDGVLHEVIHLRRRQSQPGQSAFERIHGGGEGTLHDA